MVDLIMWCRIYIRELAITLDKCGQNFNGYLIIHHYIGVLAVNWSTDMDVCRNIVNRTNIILKKHKQKKFEECVQTHKKKNFNYEIPIEKKNILQK